MEQHFSVRVDEATRKFVDASQRANAEIQLYDHPLTGPSGERLQTGVAWLGPRNATQVLMLISGTHGIEGYAGSAITVAGLEAGLFSDLPDDTAVLLIHLINPWGCAWFHRHTENNADLYRDVLYYKPELFSDDPCYDDELDLALVPRSWEGPAKEASDACFQRRLSTAGLDEIIRIMRVGQHRYPDGFCYNGGGVSWSHGIYRDICQRYLGQCQRIFSVDIHTGFGDYGAGICIPCYYDSDSDQRKMARVVEAFGKSHIYVAGFDPTIPRHPRKPWETAEDFFPELEITSIGLEFGTYPYASNETMMGVHRYMAYLLVHGDLAKPERQDLFDLYQRQYYPQEAPWKALVCQRGQTVIQQALGGLAAWAREDETKTRTTTKDRL